MKRAILGCLAVACCGSCARPEPRHAEIPLHWELASIDSVGGIPADEFLCMPSDRVRPKSPAYSVPGGGFVATFDSAIAARLIFRRTAYQVATRYSREQQFDFWVDMREVLGRRPVIDSLWAQREETIQHLEGRLPLGGHIGTSQAFRVISSPEAQVLRSLPLLAWFELKDVAAGVPVQTIAPRQFQQDLWSLNWAPRGVLCLPATLAEEVSADTSLPLSTRIEFFRTSARLTPFFESGPQSIAWPDSATARAVARMSPLVEAIRSERRLKSRYHYLDDPQALGSPLR